MNIENEYATMESTINELLQSNIIRYADYCILHFALKIAVAFLLWTNTNNNTNEDLFFCECYLKQFYLHRSLT